MRREVLRKILDPREVPATLRWVEHVLLKALPGGEVALRLSRPTRSLEQNAKMWAMLNDVSKQVDWYGHKLRPDEWKDVFTAALKSQKVIPGIYGGFVVVGMSTSRMSVSELSDLIELMYSFGAEREVVFTEA